MPRVLHQSRSAGNRAYKNPLHNTKVVHGLGILSMLMGMGALPVTLIEPTFGGVLALAAMMLSGIAALQGELRYTMIATALATLELFWLSAEFSLDGNVNTVLVAAIALPYVWSMVCLKLGLNRMQAREYAKHRSHYLM